MRIAGWAAAAFLATLFSGTETRAQTLQLHPVERDFGVFGTLSPYLTAARDALLGGERSTGQFLMIPVDRPEWAVFLRSGSGGIEVVHTALKTQLLGELVRADLLRKPLGERDLRKLPLAIDTYSAPLSVGASTAVTRAISGVMASTRTAGGDPWRVTAPRVSFFVFQWTSEHGFSGGVSLVPDGDEASGQLLMLADALRVHTRVAARSREVSDARVLRAAEELLARLRRAE